MNETLPVLIISKLLMRVVKAHARWRWRAWHFSLPAWPDLYRFAFFTRCLTPLANSPWQPERASGSGSHAWKAVIW